MFLNINKENLDKCLLNGRNQGWFKKKRESAICNLQKKDTWALCHHLPYRKTVRSIPWMMGHSILAVHAINNNRPVNLQSNKIDGWHRHLTLIPVVIPAASFSRQIKIWLLTSGSIYQLDGREVIIPTGDFIGWMCQQRESHQIATLVCRYPSAEAMQKVPIRTCTAQETINPTGSASVVKNGN